MIFWPTCTFLWYPKSGLSKLQDHFDPAILAIIQGFKENRESLAEKMLARIEVIPCDGDFENTFEGYLRQMVKNLKPSDRATLKKILEEPGA